MRLKAPERREQLIEVATKLFAKRLRSHHHRRRSPKPPASPSPSSTATSRASRNVRRHRPRHERPHHGANGVSSSKESPTPPSASAASPQNTPATSKSSPTPTTSCTARSPPAAIPKSSRSCGEHYDQIEEFFVSVITEGQKSRRLPQRHGPPRPAWQMINIGIGYAMISLNLSQFDHSLIGRQSSSSCAGLRV